MSHCRAWDGEKSAARDFTEEEKAKGSYLRVNISTGESADAVMKAETVSLCLTGAAGTMTIKLLSSLCAARGGAGGFW